MRFAWSLRLEGSGLMKDGRVINYTGKCPFGYGTCFEQLDVAEHPFGRGAGLRPLIPFKSVAVDPRLVAIELQNVTWITPHIEAPRCEYMRDL